MWRMFITGSLERLEASLHSVWWWRESRKADKQKRGLEIQPTVWHDLNQENSLNVAFWTLSKATETCKAENYNTKTEEWFVYS